MMFKPRLSLLQVNAVEDTPPRLRWMNFEICPHCEAIHMPPRLERLDEESPIVSRSDGVNFHLVLGDRPIEYPAGRQGETGWLSAGFWYVHEANGGRTETAVVLLRNRIPGRNLSGILNAIADKLYDKLQKTRILERGYEFEGGRLHKIS